MGLMWVYVQKMELRYLWEYGDWRYMKIINKLNEKRSLIPWRLRVPIWRINFCSRVLLRLSELPRCRGKAANCYMLFIMTREIKVSSDWFGCVLAVFFLRREGVLSEIIR